MYILALLLAAHVALAQNPYTALPMYYWDRAFPAKHTVASMYTAVAVDYTLASPEIYVAQRGALYGQPIIVYDYQGNVLRSWGKDTIPLIGGTFGVDGITLQFTSNGTFLIVADMLEHTVKKYTPTGKLVARVGTPKVAGSGTNPIQFGNVADIAVGADVILVADGEGGINDRIVAFDLDLSPTPLFIIGSLGTGPGQFNSPQSITYHNASNTFFVADRNNNRTVQISADGDYLGEWTCMQPGAPWGLRSLDKWSIIFQADGLGQHIDLFMSYYVTPTGPGQCLLAEALNMESNKCNTPHQIGVDQRTGDMYVACDGAAYSHVRRYIANPNGIKSMLSAYEIDAPMDD